MLQAVLAAPTPTRSGGAFYYRAYGLLLAANQEIVGLARAETEPAAAADVAIDFGGATLPDLTAGSEALIAEPPGGWTRATQPVAAIWRVRGPEGEFLRLRCGRPTRCVEFVADGSGRRLWVLWPENMNQADVAALLHGPGLALLLWLRGAACLHGCAVALNGAAVVLVGRAGSGKSTTAAGLARMGYPVLADDMAALRESSAGLAVEPAYPGLWLREGAAGAVHAEAEHLPRVLARGGKRRLDLGGAGEAWPYETQARPLGAIYILGERQAGLKQPAVTGIAPAAGLMLLAANRYWQRMVDSAADQRAFALLGQAARSVPIRLLARPEGVEHLPLICEAIREDFERARRQP